MSVIVTAIYGDKSFQLQITRDGSLIFLDHDIEYDIAMVEFGEPSTTAIELMNNWKQEPYEIICKNIVLNERILILLIIDWAKHVLPIFEIEQPMDKRPKNAIVIASEYIKGKIKLHNIIEARLNVWISVKTTRYAARCAAEAIYKVLKTIEAAEESATFTTEVATSAAREAANARREEAFWQIRRFIDVMKALQIGKPWPPLGATK